MGELWVYNGSWNRVENGTDFKYHNGSGYVNPSSVYVYNNGWSEVWKKSDPVTYTFRAWYSSNFRKGSFNNVVEGSSTSNDLYIGAFAGSFPTHYLSLISIPQFATDGVTDIYQVLATRPNVTSATLTLTRQSSTGSSSPSGSIYFGMLNDPNPWTVDYATLQGTNQDWSPISSGNINGLGYNSSKTFTINGQFVQEMVNNSIPMIVAGTTSLSGYTGFTASVGSTTSNYMRFYGSSTAPFESYKPTWTVTFDY